MESPMAGRESQGDRMIDLVHFARAIAGYGTRSMVDQEYEKDRKIWLPDPAAIYQEVRQ